VARVVGIDKDHLVIGDHLFSGPARRCLEGSVKHEEFMELQQRAEEEIAGLRKDLAENGRLIEQVHGVLS
jgi:hypothetical protein